MHPRSPTPSSFSRVLPTLCLLCALLASASCRLAVPSAPYPHEAVLSVIAELKLFLSFDPYTAEPGRDLEGQNIFRVSLARLDELDALVGDDYRDILAFARAQALERLGQWREAADAFQTVERLETSLSDEASVRRLWASRLADITAEPSIDTINDYMNYLDSSHVTLLQLRDTTDPKPAFPYDSFLSVEMESNRSKKAFYLFQNRFILRDGKGKAVAIAEQIIEDNASSRRFGEHLLRLGGYFEALAQDYVELTDPTSAEFDLGPWSEFITRAREAYSKVARADGDPAKPEGQARLRSLDAFAQRTLRRAR